MIALERRSGTWARVVLSAALLAWMGAAVACGGEEPGSPDAGPADAARADAGSLRSDAEIDSDAAPPGDLEAPELRDVVAVLAEPSPGTLDLSSADVVRVIAEPAPLTFRVFVRDDETPTEELTVELVDPDSGQALDGQTSELASGLWRAEITAEPGVSATVRATDAAGNEARWPYAAIFPTRAEALARRWTLLRYDDTGAVVSRRSSTWGEGTWCTEGDGAAVDPAGGTYAVDADGLLVVERRHGMACDVADYGGEWDSVEHARASSFYVDATYLSQRPLAREGSGSGAAGTWTWAASVDAGGGPAEASGRLVLGEDGSLRRELTDGTVQEGTYELRATSGYEENFGDLLIETITRVDGADVTPRTRVRFWVLRGGWLLVDPMVDAG